jgi:hypothetical protein
MFRLAVMRCALLLPASEATRGPAKVRDPNVHALKQRTWWIALWIFKDFARLDGSS